MSAVTMSFAGGLLINHWNLYYVELNKFLKCFEKAQSKKTIKSPDKDIISFNKELEQWSYFLGTIQDNSKPLEAVFNQNRGIEEVFNMLRTFTKDDRLREQYRLHEEFLRVQRGEEARKEKLKQQYHTVLLELEKERRAKEEALKSAEDIQRVSIISLRKAGYSNEEISKMLNISLQKVQIIL